MAENHKHRPRIVKCPLMRPYWTMNFFGLLLSRSPQTVTRRTVNHELIHTAQMKELLWIPFYILYGLEWLIRFLISFDAAKAYRNVSFEREAYSHDYDMHYLSHRHHFAHWRKT